jgi:hypothetical protein
MSVSTRAIGVVLDQAPRFAQRGRAVDVQAHFQERDLQQFAQVGFVVDDQDAG